MTTEVKISSINISNEINTTSSELEIKSAWVGGRQNSPGAATNSLEQSPSPPAYEQANPGAPTTRDFTSSPPSFELENLSSTPLKGERETSSRVELPAVVNDFGPPASSPPLRPDGPGTHIVPANEIVIANAVEEPPLSVWRKLCYAMGAIPFTFTQAAMGFYFTVFLLEVVKVSHEMLLVL